MILDTKERILNAAERMFAEQGFEPTSLRAIIAAAGVNLAAIHYHFRSKEALIQAVVNRRFESVNQERLDLLEQYERQTPSVEQILEAFLWPMLRVGLDGSVEGRNLLRLAGRLLLEASGVAAAAATRQFGVVASRFGFAFERALPHLTRDEVVWRVHFTIGAAAKAILGGMPSTVLSQATGAAPLPVDAQSLMRHLVAYTAAGMRARPALQLRGRRSTPRLRTGRKGKVKSHRETRGVQS